MKNSFILILKNRLVSIVSNCSGKSSQINFTNFNPSIYFDIIFKKTYVGNWQSNVIATDTYLQTSLISFSINVLRWSQTNWLYWNGPKASDWTEWVYGFKIDLQTKEWKVSEAYIESWIIILFVIVVLLITVLSDHDLNASYILLESITLYWMLFIAFEEGELRIKYYFKQILVVLTHFNSLLFPLFDSTFIVNSNINITSTESIINNLIMFIYLFY